LVAGAQARFGTQGVMVGVALGALADAQSGIAALGSLHASGALDAGTVTWAIVLAIGTNTLTRTAAAFASGGAGFGAFVSASLVLSSGLAAAAAAATGAALR
jgi:uncharacterized membrane protein (DUF4010 family)